jgi:UDP-glucose:glycoprotein glucosyltransferase
MKRRSRAILAICLVVGVVGAPSPPVKVTLRSSWPAPPLLLEIMYALYFVEVSESILIFTFVLSETVALENSDAFFPFVDRVTDPEILPSSQPLSQEAVHQFALQVAASHGFLSEPGSLAAVEMNLGLHAATPKIEAFYHHYVTHTRDPKCGSWVDWYGEVVCDVGTLSHLAGVETIDPANSSFDNS